MPSGNRRRVNPARNVRRIILALNRRRGLSRCAKAILLFPRRARRDPVFHPPICQPAEAAFLSR